MYAYSYSEYSSIKNITDRILWATSYHLSSLPRAGFYYLGGLGVEQGFLSRHLIRSSHWWKCNTPMTRPDVRPLVSLYDIISQTGMKIHFPVPTGALLVFFLWHRLFPGNKIIIIYRCEATLTHYFFCPASVMIRVSSLIALLAPHTITCFFCSHVLTCLVKFSCCE